MEGGRRSSGLPLRHDGPLPQPYALVCVTHSGGPGIPGPRRSRCSATWLRPSATDTVPPAAALGLVNLTTLARLPRGQHRGRVPRRRRRPGDRRARRGGCTRPPPGLDRRSPPHRRGARRHARHRRRRTVARAGARGCVSNRTALARHRHEGLERFNTALAVVEKLRLIETELAGALSADLRAALAFARGRRRGPARADTFICTSSSPLAAGRTSSTC